MVNLATRFPKKWQIPGGVIKRGGGRDRDGNYQKPTELELGVVLIGMNASDEDIARTDLSDTLATVYGDSDLELLSSDTIEWPDAPAMPAKFFKGSWVIIGYPKVWPLGLEIHLKKV